MLDYITLDDPAGQPVFLHRDGTPRMASRVEGLVGLPAPREVVQPRQAGHGSVVRTKFLDDRIITIEGEVWGSSLETMYGEWDTLQAVLYGAIDTDRILRFRRGGATGVEMQTAVRLSGSVQGPLEGGANFLSYQVSLRAADPRLYSTTLQTVDGSEMGQPGSVGGSTFPNTFPDTFVEPPGWGIAAYDNRGSVGTPPVFRLHGSLVNPRVGLVETGEQIAFTGEIGPQDFLEVDAAARTVSLNGVASRLNYINFPASSWWDLPPGAGTVRLRADSSSSDAYLTVLYRHAYA